MSDQEVDNDHEFYEFYKEHRIQTLFMLGMGIVAIIVVILWSSSVFLD